MSTEPAIVVNGVHKSFKLPHEQHSGIKQALVNISKRKKGFENQHVLKGISFEIKKGEFFGIVGRNGSGKSTLLKLLAGIYTPDKGHIQVNGSLTPFIELGVGFNPELTGRENVYMNGALLGFSNKEMTAMYGDIVAFAELEQFMDQKLKNYSSGMQVRLAFSIAIKAKSDILVLDEVLAVGDETFQRKCIAVFEQYKARNQTIILVTHDMGTVERFCDRAMLVKDGEIEAIGDPKKIATLYSEENLTAYASGRKKDAKVNLVDGVRLRMLKTKSGKEANRFRQGESMSIELEWDDADVEYAGVAIYKLSGEYVFGPNTYKEKQASLKGKNSISYAVDLDIGQGEYYVKAGLFGKDDSKIVKFVDEGPSFIVENNKSDDRDWEGITYLNHSWKSS